ncbi:MAG: helix-turn-helix domain-containing protein [Gammaproteobacteria bacterium]|nr:helix-turn-helix domain-containing protein [Gammaproteobacteria bacterium]
MSRGYQRSEPGRTRGTQHSLCSGLGLRAIARQLGRSPSTISRELARNRTGFYYRAVTAQNKAHRRCFRKPRRLAVDRRLRHTVFRLLRRQWSPEQIQRLSA